MQVYTNREMDKKLRDKRRRRNGPKWDQADRPRPTDLAHFEPGSPPPLTYPLIRLFKGLMPRATHQSIRHSPPRSREERDTIPERRGSR